MELTKTGYKQTEVGMIPEDWEVKSLDTATNMKSGEGITSESISEDSKYPCYGGNGLRGYTNKFTHDGNFVLIGRQGALCGNISLARGKFFASEHAVVVTPKNEIDVFLLAFILKKMNLNKYSESSAQPGLSVSKILQLKIPLPPTLAEQRAIATTLSDIDALIQNLAQLIEKKKAIKQGAMQQLLTPPNKGGKRLDGFEGDWEELTLGKSAILKARIGWQGLTTAEYLDSGDYYLVTGTDFSNGYIDWDNCVYVEKIRYDQDKYIQLKTDDVLVTKDGTIGKVAFIDKVPKLTTLNSGVFVIRPINNAYHPRYFYYILMSNHFKEFLSKLTAGSTISHLYQKDFVHYDFPAPPTIQEQRAIANILSDMDAEIQSLEAQKGKYGDVKQGMMQALLTGRVRLV